MPTLLEDEWSVRTCLHNELGASGGIAYVRKDQVIDVVTRVGYTKSPCLAQNMDVTKWEQLIKRAFPSLTSPPLPPEHSTTGVAAAPFQTTVNCAFVEPGTHGTPLRAECP